MLPRTLEPEVMDTPEEAADYDAMDHAEVNRVFVDDFLETVAAAESAPRETPAPLRVLDAGTGTAQIPIELCGRSDAATTPVHVTAVDLARHMLELARRNVDRAGLGEAITLQLVDAKRLPHADGTFDAVMSNSIVHHVPEPIDAMREMLRVLKPGGVLFVRDLRRPEDEVTLERLVETHAGGENPHQRQLFRQSLHAALTVAEMQAILREIGLDPACCRQTTDRHWTVSAVRTGGDDRS